MDMRTVRGLAGASRMVATLAVGALLAAGLTVAGPQPVAVADSAPADLTTPTTVAADGLPTVQIDGVAWSQVVVSGTVYVAGQFTTARPAGAAPGTSTVTRSNLLAYDLASGNLIASWAPSLNGPAYVITASLDGTRLYVGGNFTTVNGSAQNRFVVLNRATGQRVAGFNPNPNAAVRAIVSTPSTIYFGGSFNTVAGLSRYRLAAISATTGALLSWRVSAQSAQVEALVMSPDNSRVIVGGRFSSLGGVAAPGTGAVSASTAAVLPWAMNKVVANYGFDAGITSLSTDGKLIYGSGFGFLVHNNGSVANLEGTFAANPMTGDIVWIDDCHGDTYSVFANPGKDAIYVVGHPYLCSNIGSFPEHNPRESHYAMAFSKQDVMTITPNTVGGYYDWVGYRAPAVLDFFPDLATGSFTGQTQAAWNVTGTSEYVVYGGEFPTVNGRDQQGLVRMAVAAKSTNQLGPRLDGTSMRPAATSRADGTTQVSWATNWDPDNGTLTYDVLRDGGTTSIYTTTAKSTFWQLPRVSFTDTGLVAGDSHSYSIVARDAFGNSVTSPAVSVVVAGSGTQGAYAQAVMADNPAALWRLGEADGSALDWTGYADATVGPDVTRAVAGAPAGDSDLAARFTGSSASRVVATGSADSTNRFSVEAWFKTTSTSGGKIVGFGNSSNSDNSGNYDRHVYMGPDGRINFGVYPNTIRLITSSAAYNDGQWHHVVASLGANGMNLYLDGALSSSDPNTVSAQSYAGYWHIGGDNLGGWPNVAGDSFAGDIDEVAVYGRALTLGQVTHHYQLGTTGTVSNQSPVADFAATGGELTSSFDASASSDPDGTIASYTWDFADGSAAGTGVTTSHSYAAGGTYTVTLTVTDDGGATGTTTRQVVVTSPNAAPTASFTSTTSGSAVSTDASASTDPDGTIASYAWDFGQGAGSTGVTASHTYAAAGTYTVTLTVTDNGGATGTSSKQVTIDPATTGTLATDTFTRTVVDGFGAAELGGPWTTTAGATSVVNGAGQLSLAGANSLAAARLSGVTGTTFTTQVTESWDKRPTGSGGWFLVRGRITTAGEYRLKVGHKSNGAVTARIVRTSSTGAETAITAETTVPGLTYTAGTQIAAKFAVTGTNPTTLQVKVWAASLAQPAGWLLTATDATAALQTAGHTGVAGLLSSTSTNGPVAVRMDDYGVTG